LRNLKKECLLKVEGVSKSFPGVQALSNVNFHLYSGEIVCLVGENGAGKTTLMKILSGAYKKDSGHIFVNGKEVEIENPHHAQKLGISIIYQEFNLTRNQSVAANIYSGREPIQKGIGKYFGFVDRKLMEENSQKLLERVSSKISPKSIVGKLSVAEQQTVEIVKALAVEAKIVIMDEPTATLGEKEVLTLFDTINSLKKQGIGIIFISHRLEEVFKISERIVVMRDGQLIGELKTSQATVEKVIQMMVGRSLTDFLHKIPAEIKDTVLEVRNLNRKGKVKNVNFILRSGEILGIAGLVGSGRSEIVRLLFGVDSKDDGEIFMGGKKLNIKSPKDAVRVGLAFVPEDRAFQGLVLKLSVVENIIMATLKSFSSFGWINKRKIKKISEKFVSRLSIRTPYLHQKVLHLSGGNQQKVVLAKWLISNPRVLIMDEPTRGIDIGAKSEIYALMNELAKNGVGIIMISSELPEVLGMSDRIMVVHEGEISAVLDRNEASQKLIMSYASGQGKEVV